LWLPRPLLLLLPLLLQQLPGLCWLLPLLAIGLLLQPLPAAAADRVPASTRLLKKASIEDMMASTICVTSVTPPGEDASPATSLLLLLLLLLLLALLLSLLLLPPAGLVPCLTEHCCCPWPS
jgi:hypothetical protein